MSPTKNSTYRYSLLALLLVAFAAFGADLEKGKPEDVGLSSSRLNRIEEVFGGKVKAGEIPGYVALVARHGKVVYFEANGVQDPNTKKAMSRDSIFRIYSMTKPLTSVAALILVEEGKIKLSDPISMYLPELANLQVATNADTAKTAAELKTEPA